MEIDVPNLTDAFILRAGIIPYFRTPKNQIFFLFGLDEGIASLSDFGGTREYFDADVYHLAIREYREESIGLLEPITVDDLKCYGKCIVGETKIKKGEKCALFFYPFPYPYPLLDKIKAFKERSVPGDETKGLAMLSLEQTLLALEQPEAKIDNTKMFLFHPKIKHLLKAQLKDLVF
jgi:hypothetical protein